MRVGYVRASMLCVTAAMLVAGCSSLKKTIDHINYEAAASTGLQGFIHDKLVSEFHRPVRSVTCTPFTDQVVQGDTVNLTCAVVFTDGTSYNAQASITDPSTDPDIATYTYSFEDPPVPDITTEPLPVPPASLTAASPASLFTATNLAPLVRKLTARFNQQDLIVQLALYPGALEAVIASNGRAWAVSATSSGALTVGPPESFDGQRSGIAFNQLDPAVIQQLTSKITAEDGVPLARIARFVLANSLPGDNAGWNIYLTSGTEHFQALVLGDHLEGPLK